MKYLPSVLCPAKTLGKELDSGSASRCFSVAETMDRSTCMCAYHKTCFYKKHIFLQLHFYTNISAIHKVQRSEYDTEAIDSE
jgi:hypothetical protein